MLTLAMPQSDPAADMKVSASRKSVVKMLEDKPCGTSLLIEMACAMAFAGDKTATVFELVQDIRHKSSQHVLSRMGRTAEQLLWYYGTVQSMLNRRVTESMADFFASQVSDLRNALRVN